MTECRSDIIVDLKRPVDTLLAAHPDSSRAHPKRRIGSVRPIRFFVLKCAACGIDSPCYTWISEIIWMSSKLHENHKRD
jgi:hypothetical protein